MNCVTLQYTISHEPLVTHAKTYVFATISEQMEFLDYVRVHRTDRAKIISDDILALTTPDRAKISFDSMIGMSAVAN